MSPRAWHIACRVCTLCRACHCSPPSSNSIPRSRSSCIGSRCTRYHSHHRMPRPRTCRRCSCCTPCTRRLGRGCSLCSCTSPRGTPGICCIPCPALACTPATQTRPSRICYTMCTSYPVQASTAQPCTDRDCIRCTPSTRCPRWCCTRWPGRSRRGMSGMGCKPCLGFHYRTAR
jgi:hypothetical protein